MNSFSVLMSVYKNENSIFLEDSLSSILVDQTIIPNELIVIKDGDLTQELNIVLDRYVVKYPKILKVLGYSKNKGLGYALNLGLSKCSNEIIFRMDSDDIAHPKRFEKQLCAFRANSNVAIIGSNIEEFKSSPQDLNRFRNVPLSSNEINKKKLLRNPFNHMSVAFLKSAINDCGGYIPMPGYEDYYLWLRVLKKYDGLNLSDNLVNARIGNGMVTRRQGLVFFFNELQFQKRLLSDKLISFPIFLTNFFLRVIPRLLPIKILIFLYSKFLRK
jgi:glycosyltransferase involved in cell wall biosynthesis